MSPQDVFNRVVTHVLKQGKRSLSASPLGTPACAYRSDEGGLKCAVGCLIDDAHYKPSFNRCGVDDRAVRLAVIDSLGVSEDAFLKDYIRLLRQCQTVHDLAEDGPEFATTVSTAFAQLAEDYNLTMPEIA